MVIIVYKHFFHIFKACANVFNRAVADFGGTFCEIRPHPAPVKFLAGFGRRQCNCSRAYVHLVTDQTDTTDLSSGAFAILIVFG